MPLGFVKCHILQIRLYSYTISIYYHDDGDISGIGLGVMRPFSVSETKGLLSSGPDFQNLLSVAIIQEVSGLCGVTIFITRPDLGGM